MSDFDPTKILSEGAQIAGQEIAHRIAVAECHIWLAEIRGEIATKGRIIASWEDHRRANPQRDTVATTQITRLAREILIVQAAEKYYEQLVATSNIAEMLSLIDHHSSLDQNP